MSKIAEKVTNSTDHDPMPYFVASDLGLSVSILGVIIVIWFSGMQESCGA